MFRKTLAILASLLLALSLNLFTPAEPAGAWLGPAYGTGCYTGTTQVNLYVDAPINGAVVTFSNGSSSYFYSAYLGQGTYRVIASHGGPRPTHYAMDWRYNWTGPVTVFCW